MKSNLDEFANMKFRKIYRLESAENLGCLVLEEIQSVLSSLDESFFWLTIDSFFYVKVKLRWKMYERMVCLEGLLSMHFPSLQAIIVQYSVKI